MNWDQIEACWKVKGKAKEHWVRREQLIGIVQERYEYARDRAEHEAEETPTGSRPRRPGSRDAAFPLATLPRTMDRMNSGMLLIEHGQDAYRCELHDPDSCGIECRWFVNGALMQTRRFKMPRVAAQWAEEKRRAILAGTSSGQEVESVRKLSRTFAAIPSNRPPPNTSQSNALAATSRVVKTLARSVSRM